MADSPPPPRRSWPRFLQFRLRNFLIGVTLLAVYPPCIHWYRERAVLDSLPPHTFAYDYADDEQTAWSRTPRWLRIIALPWRGHVVEVRFNDEAVVGESHVKALAGLSRLARLRFATRIRENPEFLPQLSILPHLERLEIDPPRPQVPQGGGFGFLPPEKEPVETVDDDLGRIADCCPALRHLRIVSREITNVGVRHLARLERLETVDLTTASVTSEAFDVWKALDKNGLRKLVLDETLVFADDLVRLRGEMPGVEITGRMKATLEQSYDNPQLTQLLMGNGRVPMFRELAEIARRPSLAPLRRVTELALGHGPPQAEPAWRVDWLDQFPDVRRLTLACTEVPPAQLATLRNLEYLHLVGGFDNNRAAGEALARLPKLKEIFSVSYPGDDFFAGLSGSKSVEDVHLMPLRTSGFDEARFLETLMPLESLRALCLEGEWIFRFDDAAVRALGRLKQLQLLRLRDAGLGWRESPLPNYHELENLTRLNVLLLDNVGYGPGCLEAIGRLPNLRLLVVGDGKSGDARHLTQLKRLEAFRFSSDSVQVDDLALMVAMPSMRRVFIGSKVGGADYARLLALNPECRLSGYVGRESVGGEETRRWWMTFDRLWGYRSFDGRIDELFGPYLDPR